MRNYKVRIDIRLEAEPADDEKSWRAEFYQVIASSADRAIGLAKRYAKSLESPQGSSEQPGPVVYRLGECVEGEAVDAIEGRRL